MKKIVFAMTVLLCLNSCVVEAQDSSDTDKYDSQLLQPGDDAADFTIVNDEHPDGMAFSSLRGRYVVLEFWASWCPDCRKAGKAMVELHREYAPKGVTFVGVSFDTDKTTWQNYVKANGMDWIQHSELKKWKQETTVDAPYKVNWIPTTYVVNPEGKIVTGSVSMDKIKAALAALPLAETAE